MGTPHKKHYEPGAAPSCKRCGKSRVYQEGLLLSSLELHSLQPGINKGLFVGFQRLSPTGSANEDTLRESCKEAD